MRALIAVVLLASLAGCIDSGASPEPVEEGGPAPAVALEPGDGARVLADLKDFIGLAPRRYDNQFQHDDARAWLETQFVDAGWQVERQTFTGPSQTQGTAEGQNIVATLPGHTNATILLGAHYDSAITSAGAAYDDGTGTMLVVEMARALAQTSWDHTLMIVAFDQEEAGLVGSSFMAEHLRSIGTPLRIMLNYDMVGINWPIGLGGTVNPIPVDLYAGGDTEGELTNLWRDAVAAAGYPAEATTTQTGLGGGSSDHGPFHNADFPAAWVRGALIRSYPAYHNLDTVEAMTVAAGGSEANLVAAFQTVLDMSLAFVAALDGKGVPAFYA